MKGLKSEKWITDESENRNYNDEAVQASGRDEQEKMKIKCKIDKESLILPHYARFISVVRYDLVIIIDDVGFFPAKISIRSHLK